MEGTNVESDRFDGLVRAFGQARSRRQTLRGLAGVLATAVFAVAVPEAEARQCSKQKPCPECYRCRRHRCRKRADDYPCSGGICQGGACETCLARKADCTDAEECCQDGGETTCAPIGQLNQNQCCRPLGGACPTPGEWQECCGIVEGGSLVRCAPNNTCGGPGALCHTASTCASGKCCEDFPGMGVCC
jgi:hypothetical protein